MRQKTAKQKNPRSSGSALVNLQKVEKAFLAIPKQLAKEISTVLHTYKKKAAQARIAQAKQQTQLKQIENRIQAASKIKHTAMGKKQLVAAKKKYQKAAKIDQTLKQAQLELIKTVEQLQQKQVKLLAIAKHLNQFESEWKKQSAIAKPAVKTKKATSSTKNKAKKVAADTASPIPSTKKHPHVETIEAIVDNTEGNQLAETAS